MKNIKSFLFCAAAALTMGQLTTSCDLDLKPLDNYGSGNYWNRESHHASYMVGMHVNLRDHANRHMVEWGEMRSGVFAIENLDPVNAGYVNFKTQTIDMNNTVGRFGEVYGKILNVNLFIERTEAADYMSDAEKKYYLGQAYGLRAFYYFDLYRIYGGVPLQLEPEVVNGNTNPNELYRQRSTPKEVMAQIKEDIKASLDNFGNNKEIRENKGYWSKAATECLAGEVYLWTAKVTTGDNPSNPADLSVAESHLTNVMNNYGFQLVNDFKTVYDVEQKGNSEVIMSIRYADGEASNGMSGYVYAWTNNPALPSYFGEDGVSFRGNDTLKIAGNGLQYHQYKRGLFKAFDKKDSRRDATFLAAYSKDEQGNLSLAGTYLRKNLGKWKDDTNSRVYCGDWHLYRLPMVYLMLAEIENMKGGDPAKYINLVRKRAYGENWDEDEFGYTNGSFTQNELAILHERDKEFVMEGQRWFDICRMTYTKGGDALIFHEEANYYHNDDEFKKPILDKATESHKVLWPITLSDIDSNVPKLTQTPGY